MFMLGVFAGTEITSTTYLQAKNLSLREKTMTFTTLCAAACTSRYLYSF